MCEVRKLCVLSTQFLQIASPNPAVTNRHPFFPVQFLQILLFAMTLGTPPESRHKLTIIFLIFNVSALDLSGFFCPLYYKCSSLL